MSEWVVAHGFIPSGGRRISVVHHGAGFAERVDEGKWRAVCRGRLAGEFDTLAEAQVAIDRLDAEQGTHELQG